jgi:hypothetical protein
MRFGIGVGGVGWGLGLIFEGLRLSPTLALPLSTRGAD